MKYGIAIILLAFFAIVATMVFIGSGNGNSNNTKVARATTLADYENKDTANITWTHQGRHVGDDERRAVRVTVARNSRTVEVLEGYEERVGKSQTFPNSPAAFSAFIRALDDANFGKERTVKQPDERGVCPLGNRFIYRLTDAGTEVMRTWSDNCSVANGPFGGGKTGPLITQLFRAQIPDYQKFTSGLQLQ